MPNAQTILTFTLSQILVSIATYFHLFKSSHKLRQPHGINPISEVRKQAHKLFALIHTANSDKLISESSHAPSQNDVTTR